VSRWRLLLDGPGAGPWNMGMDEALLSSVVAGGTATLRLYRWDGPWLSLGYSQNLSPDAMDACERAGVGVVRRVTGGRAVLHGGDLTYTVAAASSQLPEGLSASYAVVCQALSSALGRIGVPVDPAPGDLPSAPAEFDCFASTAGHEISVAGRKLAGSAQRRAGGGVLQHGSIRVQPDPPQIARLCGIAPDRSTSLAELGRDPTAEALEQACIAGFSEALGCSFELDTPTTCERRKASGRKAF